MVERRLQVTKKKTGTGLTMKTLEGVISYADQDVDASVRRLTRHNLGATRLIDSGVETTNYFDEMRSTRYGSTAATRCIEGNPRERHLLSSGGIELAPLRTSSAQEEV